MNNTACDEADDLSLLVPDGRLEELRTLKGVVITSALFSVLGSAFLIATYHLTRTQRSLGFSIVYWLSISDLCSSLVFVVDGASPLRELARDFCPASFCLFKAALSQV